VRFSLPPRIRLGGETSAQIKTTTLLGRRDITVVPTGTGRLQPDSTIPLTRTTSPYSLNDALGDLSTTVRDLDTDQLDTALSTLSDALSNTPAPLRDTLAGVSALSQSINRRDEALRSLLAKAQTVTGVLSARAGQINSLLTDGNQLLGELAARRGALSALIAGIDAVSRQITGLVRDNQRQLQPALNELDRVLALLQRNKDKLDQSLDGLVGYATTLGEQVGNGPYFGANISNFSDIYIQIFSDTFIWPSHVPQDFHSYLTNPPLSFQPPDGGPPPSAPKPPAVPANPGGPRR
jgi:phospholipid/cholesterol/gamma-HCH transport system substrate-binding protein